MRQTRLLWRVLGPERITARELNPRLDVDDRHEFGLGVPTRNVDRLSIANARDPVLVLDGATIER